MVLPHPSSTGGIFRERSGSYAEINSASFLAEVRSGNPGREKAFARLFRGTYVQLSAYVRRHFPDPGQAEDILQEAYLAVHRGLPRFEGRSKLSTWIFTLAHHKICDRLSEKYREAEFPKVHPDSLEGIASEDLMPDHALMQAELVEMVQTAAARLVRKYRDVHYLRDYEGLSGEETSRVLGISETLVRVRLHRARVMIAQEIRSRFPQASEGHPVRLISSSRPRETFTGHGQTHRRTQYRVARTEN